MNKRTALKRWNNHLIKMFGANLPPTIKIKLAKPRKLNQPTDKPISGDRARNEQK